MLYLIRSFTRSGTFLKIGYTGNLEQRMKQYLIENPGRELISTRQGELIDETLMHLYLTALGMKAGFLEEWFVDCDTVLSGFHDSRSKIEKTVWAKRESLFTAFDFSRRSFKVQIYESLRFQHRNESLNTLLIDKEWKQWNLKEEVKAYQNIVKNGMVEFLN